jgi:serine/threonine protein kinase
MTPWAPGTSLGPYVLVAPLGAGGMGEVWKARDTRVDRIVAIKRLKSEHAERFKRETRASPRSIIRTFASSTTSVRITW